MFSAGSRQRGSGVAYGQAIDSETLTGCLLTVSDGISLQILPGRPIPSAPRHMPARNHQMSGDGGPSTGSGAWSSVAGHVVVESRCRPCATRYRPPRLILAGNTITYHQTLPGDIPAVFSSRLPGRTRLQRPAVGTLWKKTIFYHFD